MSRELLQFDDVRIVYRNFQGRGDKYNREGDRNFCIVIPDADEANRLVESGWNVKIKPPRNEGDDPFHFLPVNVKYGKYPPKIYLDSGFNMVLLDEFSVGCLDDIDIISVDVDVSAYDWEVNGREGRTAYVQAMRVVQRLDRFAAMSEEREYSNE